MKKKIAILSLIAIFFTVTAVSAQTSTDKKETVKTEVKCDKKADTKCCPAKSDAECCKTKKETEKTCCKEVKSTCKKETAKTADLK